MPTKPPPAQPKTVAQEMMGRMRIANPSPMNAEARAVDGSEGEVRSAWRAAAHLREAAMTTRIVS